MPGTPAGADAGGPSAVDPHAPTTEAGAGLAADPAVARDDAEGLSDPGHVWERARPTPSPGTHARERGGRGALSGRCREPRTRAYAGVLLPVRPRNQACPQDILQPHRLTEDDFGLLNYALVEMQRLCLDVPPVPPNAYMPYYLREYVTRLVNGFKPLVSRSARLYRILGFWCTCGSGPGRPPLRSGCDPRKWPWTLA